MTEKTKALMFNPNHEKLMRKDLEEIYNDFYFKQRLEELEDSE